MDLFKRSIEIILSNQHPSGAYVASPNFPTYQYCWFRDASYVAYSMNLAGEHESAARYHAWAARTLNERSGVVARALRKIKAGEALVEADILHTRLTLDGQDATQEEWANFQIDGFGTWLWALNQHRKLSGTPLPTQWLPAADLAVNYLAALWQHPNSDCWEENPKFVHPYSLSAIYGGLQAYIDLWSDTTLASPTSQMAAAQTVLADIRAYLAEHFVFDGHFVKFSGKPAVDASLLGLVVPYQVFTPDDPRIQATIAEIEHTLCQENSGVRRYSADTYYGGGEWILLSAWLGWAAIQTGNLDLARQQLAWIEAQANSQGELPEQVPDHLNDPDFYPIWVNRWGPIATPLLWSHAKYIILASALGKKPQ